MIGTKIKLTGCSFPTVTYFWYGMGSLDVEVRGEEADFFVGGCTDQFRVSEGRQPHPLWLGDFQRDFNYGMLHDSIS